ncbi:MAG: pyridoxal phosphate-dependent class II aminotransferase [Nitrospinae bacterium]|nr:pyridoxal phosphate-dependent class II aminotransferase [Nitrospinota bacterium]MBL7020430.1 pyridoxal phosphate-dependent class II aminotransferase [Nitrospinaceae bacterium]
MAEISGTDPDKLIDFSASINPLSASGCVSQLLLETPRLLREYPDPHCSVITERISEVTGVPEDWIRVTNGSTEMIYLLPHLFHEGQEIAIIEPCFSEYEKSFMAFGIQSHSIELEANNGFQVSPFWLFSRLDTIQQLGAIVLGNPASPTGKLYGDLLPQLQEYCERRDLILIVDEAFIDFSSPDNSAWNLLNRNSNLILIRSLTKFYSIPGLRVGYGILHPEKIQKIAPRQYPWSVNALAQAVGAEVILDKTFQENTRAWTHHERSFMFQALGSIKEVEVFPSDANYLLFRIRDNSPPVSLYQHLLSQSLLVRNCGNFKGLDERFFRISLRERRENQELVDSISAYFSSCNRDQVK